jgi:RNA polymerase sigma-70 factor (ECF subfamily)
VSAIASNVASQDDLYQDAAAQFGPALDRLARAYEFDPEKRRDLLQEIHFALWRSFATYDNRCSLRTWIYRVAHNTATTQVVRQRRIYSTLVSLEELAEMPVDSQSHSALDRRHASERLTRLIQKLKPLDRQVIVSYLEGMDAAATGEITGLSPGNVAMKIHRIKTLLARQFHSGASHAE